MLGLADAVIVTADSVSMVSEAAATGKPVHVVPLDGRLAPSSPASIARWRRPGSPGRFAATIERWSYAPPDDSARAGAAIRDLLARRLAEVA